MPAKPRIGTWLVALAGAYLSAAAVMSLVFASGPPPEVGGHVAELEAAMTLYRLGFVGASFLGPTLIGVMILLLSVAEVPAAAPRRWLGSTLLASYLPFATVLYSSQYTLLPSLLRQDPDAAALWYLHDPNSIPYALDLTGYAVLGLALIVLAPALRAAGGAYRWMRISLLAVAGFSLAAFGFHALGATTATSVASATSAAFTVPFMLLAIRAGWSHRRSGEAGSAVSTDASTTWGRREAPITEPPPEGAETRLELFWIPLGAGARVVRMSGRIYEALHAAAKRRPRASLYHSALVASTDGRRFVIEVAPTIDAFGHQRRGAVVVGPVGSAALGRWRAFRYEVRCWRGGSIPDVEHAVGSPVLLTEDPVLVHRVLDLVPTVPPLVWGRDSAHAGEMWNSNSVTSWLLVRSGLVDSAGEPPGAGRAPGWLAGVQVGRDVFTTSP